MMVISSRTLYLFRAGAEVGESVDVGAEVDKRSCGCGQEREKNDGGDESEHVG
jgi:hypothetical protein